MNTPDISLDLARNTLLELQLDGLKRELATLAAPARTRTMSGKGA
jgi:hypothetical protein